MENIELNKPVIFYKNLIYKFPNFTIEYLGERLVEVSNAPNKPFKYKDYKISSTSGEFTTSWTSGMGELSPLEFEVDSIKYLFRPYVSPTRVVKKDWFEDTEIFAFLCYVDLNKEHKLYTLVPVLKKQSNSNFNFYFSDPEKNVIKEIEAITENNAVVSNPEYAGSTAKVLLRLEKPLDYLNYGMNLFFLPKDKTDTKPIDNEIILVDANEEIINIFYSN